MRPLVSIIIPFYNEEAYLERSVESAFNQTYTNTEIILVNDGSTDDSLKIAEKFCSYKTNVKLFTTENFGLGNARNLGVKKATGEFILFLDSDDSLKDNCVERLVKEVQEKQADVVVCMFSLFNKKYEKINDVGWKQGSKEIKEIKGIKGAKGMYNGRVASVAWAKLYKADLIKDIQFPVGLWFEDRPYVLEVFLNAKKIHFIEESLFNIYAREESISRRVITQRRLVDHHAIFLKEIELIKKYQKEKELLTIIIEHHLNVILDNYLIISIDKNRSSLENINKSKEAYLKYAEMFNNYLKSTNYSLKLKKQIQLALLKLPSFLPWNAVEFLIARVLFPSKYKMIKKLKN